MIWEVVFVASAVLRDRHLLALQPSSKRSLQAETLPDGRVLGLCLKVFGVRIYL